MAKLSSDSLVFEYKYKGFHLPAWIEYEFFFWWDGESIVNDVILKRWSDYWGNRSKSALLANDYGGDGFIDVLERVLDTNKPDYWQPMEPDVLFAIYPEMYFPFLPSERRVIWESDKFKQEREARQRLKELHGKLPDDLITLIFFVDTYNFRNCGAYSGDGISLHMVVKRDALEWFRLELKKEYAEFKARFNVDEEIERYENELDRRVSDDRDGTVR